MVHPERMQCNLELTQGLIASEAAMMSLTRYMGRHQAHRLLYEAAQRSQSEGVSFAQAIKEHAQWASEEFPEDVLSALDAASYVGESAALTTLTVERVSSRS
jgi:adenylosuccinate lyase/3-carboxy-cis,cis-muconate cycloisomerase